MVYQEKCSFFVRLKYDTNKQNIWENNTIVSSYQTNNNTNTFTIYHFQNNTYSLSSSLDYKSNLYFQQNRKFIVKEINIYINPIFQNYYRISKFAINTKTDTGTNSVNVWNELTYSTMNIDNTTYYLNITINTNILKEELFLIELESKDLYLSQNWNNQTSIVTPYNLIDFDIFNIEVYGSYIPLHFLDNVNILATNFYHVTINYDNLNNYVTIFENNFTQDSILPQQISQVAITNKSDANFITKQQSSYDEINFFNIPGKQATFTLGSGTLNNAQLSDGADNIYSIDTLVITGGLITIYNIKDSYENDKIINFYLEVHVNDRYKLPNPDNNRIYIYSDLYNHNNIILNNLTPITFAAQTPGGGSYSFPSLEGKSNYILTNNGANLLWTSNVNIESLTTNEEIKSNGGISVSSGVGSTFGYNFHGSTAATKSGIRYNTDNSTLNFYSDDVSTLSSSSTNINANVPLNILYSGTQSDPAIKFNNTNTGIYASSSDTINFTCSGAKKMSISPTEITLDTDLNTQNNNITCNHINFQQIGSSINSGTINAQNINVNSISCNSISYVSNNAGIIADYIECTNVACDSITTTGIINSITTGTVTADNIQSAGVVRLPSGSVNDPSLRIGSSIGLYQESAGQLNITDGSSKIFSISKQNGLECIAVSTDQVNALSIESLEKLKINKGTISEPALQFADKSGIYQVGDNEIKFAVKNTTSNLNELALTVNSDGLTAQKIVCSTINTTNRIVLPNGSKDNTSLQFENNANTGIYQEASTNQLNISVGGVKQLSVTTSGVVAENNITCQNTISAANATCTGTMTSPNIVANTLDSTVVNMVSAQSTTPEIKFQNSEYKISRDTSGNLNVSQQDNVIMKVEPSQTVTLKSINATSSITSQGPIVAAEGTRFQPSIQFGSVAGNGIYKEVGQNNLNFAIGSNMKLSVQSTGITVPDNIVCQNDITCNNLTSTLNVTSLNTNAQTSTVSNQITLTKSTSSILDPTIKFGENIKMYQPSSGQLNIASGTSDLVTINDTTLEVKTPNLITSGNIQSNGSIVLSSGTKSSPAIRFQNNSGIYQHADSSLVFAHAGNDVLKISNTGIIAYNGVTSYTNVTCNSLTCETNATTVNMVADTVNVNTKLTMNKYTSGGVTLPGYIEFQNGTRIVENSNSTGIDIINASSTPSTTIFSVTPSGVSNVNSLSCTSLTTSSNVTVNGTASISGAVSTSNLTSSGSVQISQGSVSQPALKFADNTGIYQSNTGKLNFAVNSSDILSLTSSQITSNKSINCAQDITCNNVTASNLVDSKYLEADEVTSNSQINVNSGTNLNPAIKFSDGTGIFQPSAGKIAFANNQAATMATIDETGISTANNISAGTITSTTLNTGSISCAGTILSNQFTTQNQIIVNSSGSASTPNILFTNGTGIYEKSTGGVVVCKNATNYVTIDSDGLSTSAGVNVSSGQITANSVTANQVTASGTVTATFIDAKNSVELAKGSVSQPALTFSDNAGIFQSGSKNISFTDGTNTLLSINPSGISTSYNINCKNLTATNNIYSTSISTNNINVNQITANTMNVNQSVTLPNGLVTNPAIKFSDNSGIYKPLDGNNAPISGRIGFTNGTTQLAYLDSTGLYCPNDITSANNLNAQNVNATNVNITNLSSTNVTGDNITCNNQILLNSDGTVNNPAVKFGSSNSGIYKPGTGSIGISDGSSSLLIANTGGVTFSKDITCDQNMTCSNLTCVGMTTSGQLTVSTANTTNISVTNRLNISKGSLDQPIIQFGDGTGIYQSGSSGIDVSINKINTCSFNSSGLLANTVTSSGRFSTDTAGSNTNLTLSNGASSNTGLWVNNASQTVGFTNNGTSSLSVTATNITSNRNLFSNAAIILPDRDLSTNCSIQSSQTANTGINMTATDINYYVNGTNIIDINSSGINLMTGNIIMPSGGRITVSGDTYANGGIQFVGTNQITIRSPNTGAYHGFNIGSTGVTLEASSTNRMSFLGSTVTITNCNFSVNNSGSMVFGVNNIGNGQTLASGSNRSYMQFFNFTNANINLDITTGVLMGHVIKLIVPGNTLYSASITPISTATIRLVNGWVTTAGSSPVIATIGSSGAAGAQQSVATNTRLTLIKDRVYELVWFTTDSAWYMSMLSAPFG